MSRRLNNLRRREFLKSGLATTAGIAANSAGASIPVPADIPKRSFGKTGLTLPVLGMGSSPLVAAWSQGYASKPGTVEERAKLVRYAYDRGVRYFDTARTYYDAEHVMGLGLKGVASNCVIATKVTVRTPDMVRRSVEKSLETLGVDRVDVMQIHSSGAIEHGGFEPSMKIHAELVKLRDEGLFKYIALTTHVAFETVYQLIATGGFDQALWTICYFNKGMNTILSKENRVFREKCLNKAADLGMGVAAMKVMGASIFGRASRSTVRDYDPVERGKLPAAAIRWVLKDPRVSVLAMGMGYHEDVDENIDTLTSDVTFTPEDERLLADFSAKAYESPRIKAMGVDDEQRSSEDIARTAFQRYDRNRDRALSRQEVPADQRRFFDDADTDNNGSISPLELKNAIERRRGQ